MKKFAIFIAVALVLCLLAACQPDTTPSVPTEPTQTSAPTETEIPTGPTEPSIPTEPEAPTETEIPTEHTHIFSAPSCTAPAQCVCGATQGKPLDHSYTATKTPATCNTDGFTTYLCTCGDSYTADIVAAGHQYENYLCIRCDTIDPLHIYDYWLFFGGDYYTSLTAAIRDANAGTPGAAADTQPNAATACSFTLDGKLYIALLQDVTLSDSLTLTQNLTLDLQGHTLTVQGQTALTIDGAAICINSSKTGGTIVSEGATSGCGIKLLSGCADLTGLQICVSGTGTTYGIAQQSGTTLIGSDLVISTTGTGTTYGIYSAGEFTVLRTTVTALSDGAKSRSLYVTATGAGTVTDCSFRGLCTLYQATSVSSSQGINNAGSLIVNDCYAWGSHSGVTSSGALTINGGTYESPGHGGLYLGNVDAPAYIRDAVLRSCAPPENCTADADNNDCGFYIGGGAGRDHIVVYMDNCEIYANLWAFCLRGSSGEQNNTLYISNSRLTGSGFVRVDNTTHRLFVGVGNNFTGEDARDHTGISTTAAVTQTTDTYRTAPAEN